MRFPSLKNKIFVVLLVLAVIFSLNLFQKQAKGFFYSISSPFQSFLWEKGSAAENFFSLVFSGSALQEKNTKLQQENFALQAKVIELENLQKEDEQLRQAFGLQMQKNFQTVSVHIIGKDPSEDMITIDKGKSSGIAAGMPVITSGSVLAGKIVEVFGDVSRVMLVSDKKSSFDVAIPEKQITGLLTGKGSFLAALDLVDKSKNLADGDVAVTSRLGGMFPQNLLVGTVKNIKKNDLASFQSATVVPLFDIDSAAILFVITQQK